MKVLVTGGAGYFGSLLIDKLIEQGHECVCYDINPYDGVHNVESILGDILDYNKLYDSLEDVNIIHHNVAQVPLAKNVQLFNDVNIKGTENILKAALDKGISKVVYTSSSAVFGVPKKNPVMESTPPSPAEAYGKAKYEGEVLCEKYINLGLDVSIIRPRTILGHGRLGIFQILFDWISQGYNVPVFDGGENIYQFVHSDDLADACIRAGNRQGSSVYNIGTNEFGTMKESLEALCSYAGTGSKVRSVPMAPTICAMNLTSRLGISPLGAYHSLMYGKSMYFDISKAEAELGWSPKYSNVDMFIDSYEWYIKNKELVLSQSGKSHHRSALKQGVLSVVKRLL